MIAGDCLEVVDGGSRTGIAFWVVLFSVVAAFEIWAIVTGHQTLSQTVSHGPRWFRWTLFGGFVILLWHLFL